MNVCVFCGASGNVHESYLAAARDLGCALAKNGLGVVYGGAAIGLMGAVADGALEAGGRVIGIIPKGLADLEIAHTGLTELITVDSLAVRKTLMADRAEAFVSLPGGGGTLDEFFEVFTWFQLGLHTKPITLINTRNYWKPLLAMLDHAVAEGFIDAKFRDAVWIEETPGAMAERLVKAIAQPA